MKSKIKKVFVIATLVFGTVIAATSIFYSLEFTLDPTFQDYYDGFEGHLSPDGYVARGYWSHEYRALSELDELFGRKIYFKTIDITVSGESPASGNVSVYIGDNIPTDSIVNSSLYYARNHEVGSDVEIAVSIPISTLETLKLNIFKMVIVPYEYENEMYRNTESFNLDVKVEFTLKGGNTYIMLNVIFSTGLLVLLVLVTIGEFHKPKIDR